MPHQVTRRHHDVSVTKGLLYLKFIYSLSGEFLYSLANSLYASSVYRRCTAIFNLTVWLFSIKIYTAKRCLSYFDIESVLEDLQQDSAVSP